MRLCPTSKYFSTFRMHAFIEERILERLPATTAEVPTREIWYRMPIWLLLLRQQGVKTLYTHDGTS